MELIELNRTIEKTLYLIETAKTEKEATTYKNILCDLRKEKKELLNKEFNRK